VEHKLAEGDSEFTLAPEGFHESFCANLPAAEAAFYVIIQPPLARAGAHRGRSDTCLAQPSGVGRAADRGIDPGVHRSSYQRMGAMVTALERGSPSGHDLSPPRSGCGRPDRSPRLRQVADLKGQSALAA
jgi:hypothetical protein